ncbi:MAG TPA: hypothetical protein VLZ33_05545, partial [Dysgonamonadaceae bacterium]|nr:hypothetical protein [Dysgonamonadaceae bacterium]
EKRAFIKSIIKRKADILPDYVNNTLTIKLYTMSTPRENRAIEEICNLSTDTQTVFPGTNMRLIYKSATL